MAKEVKVDIRINKSPRLLEWVKAWCDGDKGGYVPGGYVHEIKPVKHPTFLCRDLWAHNMEPIEKATLELKESINEFKKENKMEKTYKKATFHEYRLELTRDGKTKTIILGMFNSRPFLSYDDPVYSTVSIEDENRNLIVIPYNKYELIVVAVDKEKKEEREVEC